MVPRWAIQPSPGENSRHLGTEVTKGGRLELGKTEGSRDNQGATGEMQYRGQKHGTRVGQSWAVQLGKGDFTTGSVCKAGDWDRDPVSLEVWQPLRQSPSQHLKQHGSDLPAVEGGRT